MQNSTLSTSGINMLLYIFIFRSVSPNILCCCFSGKKLRLLRNTPLNQERICHIQTLAFYLSVLLFKWMSAHIFSLLLIFFFLLYCFTSLCCLSLSRSVSFFSPSLSHLYSITLKHETSTLPGSFNMCHNFDVAASFTAIYLLCCFGISVTLLLTCLMVEKWLSEENYCCAPLPQCSMEFQKQPPQPLFI